MAPSDADAIRAVYERWAQGDFWTPEIFDPHVRTVWIEEMPGLNESRGPAVMDLHGAHVWTMRDGRATALQAYASVQEAAAAAGICLE